MTVPKRLYTYVNGQKSDGSQITAEFDQLYNMLAAGLTSDNIKAGGITKTSLGFTVSDQWIDAVPDQTSLASINPSTSKAVIVQDEKAIFIYDVTGSAWVKVSVAGGVVSHKDLTDRNAPDQHPISAITGLQAALDAKTTGTGVGEFNASGSGATTTASTTAGSPNITVVDPSSFSTSQYINLVKAGANNANFIAEINSISGSTLTLSANVPGTFANAKVLHDDTQAIQSALNAASQAGANPTVYLPGGTFYISQTLKIPNGVILHGLSESGTKIIVADNSNVCALESSNENVILTCAVSDLTFDGNSANNLTANVYGMWLKGMQNSKFRNVTVQNFTGAGIVLDKTAGAIPSTNNTFTNVSTDSNGGDGFHVSDTTCINNTLVGGKHNNNKTDNVYSAATINVKDVISTNSQTGNGVSLDTGSDLSVVEDCDIEGNNSWGIRTLSNHNQLDGNKIYNNWVNVQSDGIYVNGTNVSITNNKIMAGLDAVNGRAPRYAINLDVNHHTAHLFGNEIRYIKKGGLVDNTRTLVNGLQSGDKTDYSWSKSEVIISQTAAQTVPAGWTKLVSFSPSMDEDGLWLMPNQGYFPRYYGRYHISAVMAINGQNAGDPAYLAVYKNGSEVMRIAAVPSQDNTLAVMTGSTEIYLNPLMGDDLEFYIYASHQGTTSLGTNVNEISIRLT